MGHGAPQDDDLLGDEEGGKAEEEFAIVFAAMGVNMETAHFFKQVRDERPAKGRQPSDCHT